jgi:hypothetical protein
MFLSQGFGVFTTTDFCKGSFLLDYAGKLISPDDAEKKDNKDYIYFFQIGSRNYWYVFFLHL